MIVIPMAGLSSRFFNAGYTKPKYMLEAHNETLFAHSVRSFQKYFSSEYFLFVVRDIYDTENFVNAQADYLGIKYFSVFVLEEATRGQAETVALALFSGNYSGQSLTIFNIDTFRPNFIHPDLKLMDDGYLEVFKGSGSNWSFVRPINSDSTLISEATEKDPISNLCSTGLYHFSSVDDFLMAFERYESLGPDKWVRGELYIAPIYNYLISAGKKIHYNLIDRDSVIFCGTPAEYSAFLG
ncbi:glycosyltransferase family 2 protein [Microbulbifer elongatus]|uniref:glycosyltransferase family 2 protein n=1 Tax=Microbulbifer elongatus TaxID=86173 RepID=UPI001CFF12B1|nr:glycosyltransferase family 2 protein [Microbulbifer elongatus]